MAAAAVLRSIPILVSFLMCLEQFVLSQVENQFIFNGFNGSNLHLNGIAEIQPNGLLQLTNTSKRQTGHAFFPFPLKFNKSSTNIFDSLSFSTNFMFAIVPAEETNPRGGHGIAFTISPTMELPGAAPTQYLGLFNSSTNGLSSNHVFAVELDAVPTTEFGDISGSHVGVDVNNLRSLVSAPPTYFADGGESKSLDLLTGNPMQLWIDYEEDNKLLNVTLAPMRSNKPSRPLLSTSVDLSTVLLDSMYVGFSSSTGELTSSQYILGWSFNKTGKAQSLDYSKLPSLPNRSKSKSDSNLRIIIPLITVVALLVTIFGGAYVTRRKKYEEIREEWEKEYGPQRFCFKDLYKATKGFKEKELLGSGGFGRVYRGVLPSSKEQVAVKRISHDSRQGMKEFVSEIVSMGRLRHRNLVQLLGYCRRRGELILVYDYMPNGSLDKFLFSNSMPNLSWDQRFRILKGVASSLLYLHEEWEQVVLHRDVKASNILVDANFNGRLGDFGLAKLYDHGSNPSTTRVVGTVGYIAPELARTGKATTSTDVFAFGTFMLELACGRKPLEPQLEPEQIILAEWVCELWKAEAILDASDPRLEGDYVSAEMELILKLGVLCTNPIAANRPSTRQMVQHLDGNITLPEIPPDGVRIDMMTVENVTSTGFAASFPTSYEENSVSANSFSSSISILSSGR
ncbi:putative L-type lectin-domain containing receptor kinase I.6 [Hibiscus syriacus]|uniref:non-specific serine/threonine protein kinase n=1 Tax=Hibiscus syriacus TaxID=106335 RepID=A0A6A2ZZ60_HIBSY|nr:L-type lectin-domain containing receptor kinase SIT2-like [Hibiscus syriacus]KAE8696667.1 putative L-type lectin-domain containing receptor kinase I.6 [Hibiscus syriacus]